MPAKRKTKRMGAGVKDLVKKGLKKLVKVAAPHLIRLAEEKVKGLGKKRKVRK